MSRISRFRPRIQILLVGLCAALLGGCGSNTPVSGKVTVDGAEPAVPGSLRYVPDKAKGNTLPTEPIAQVAPDGTYKLTTDGKPGAPVGAYKVVVSIGKPSNSADPYSLPISLVNKKYAAAETTDLAVEVVASPAPGAYDLKLSR